MTPAQMYPWLEWPFALYTFLYARFVILALNPDLEAPLTGGPCEIPDAIIAAGSGPSLLSGFDFGCSEATTLRECEVFLNMRLSCRRCMTLSIGDNSQCFQNYWQNGIEDECMNSVTTNFYNTCFGDNSALAIAAASYSKAVRETTMILL